MVAALGHPVSLRTANDRLKESSASWFWASLAMAALVHFLVLSTVQLQADERYLVERNDPAVVVPLPTIDRPQPPEDIVRPDVPGVGPGALDRIAVDPVSTPEILWDPPVGPMDPPVPVGHVDDRAWIPREVEPRLLNGPEIQRALERAYPSALRATGMRGTAVFDVFVGAEGTAERMELHSSSGSSELDAAARRVLAQMEFAPALNRDRPVGVWVRIPLRFQVR